MNKGISNLKKTWMFLPEIIHNLTEEELNSIPEGYNNSIIWNVGHLLARQQAFSYLHTVQKNVYRGNTILFGIGRPMTAQWVDR